MSVEGMWAMVAGEAAEGEVRSGGVIVLETGRVFGGDSVVAYVGTYSVEGSQMTAQVERWKYNASIDGIDVFGDDLDNMPNATFRGTRGEVDGATVISGSIWRDTDPSLHVPVFMKKMRD